MTATGLTQIRQMDLYLSLLTPGVFGRTPVLSSLRSGCEVRCTRLTMKSPFTDSATRAPIPALSQSTPGPCRLPDAQHSTSFNVQGGRLATHSPPECLVAKAFCCLGPWLPEVHSLVKGPANLQPLSEPWPLSTSPKAADSQCWSDPPPAAGSEEGEEPAASTNPASLAYVE